MLCTALCHCCLPACVRLAVACRYENTERRKSKVEALGLRYMGMGVSGGEEGARHGELSVSTVS